MKVYIAQLKCPQNHAILASVGEFETEQEAASLEQSATAAFSQMLADGKAKPDCAICGSKKLHVEIAPTAFETVDDAMPYLLESGRRQLQTRALIQMLRESRN